jgi:hypothetical protein
VLGVSFVLHCIQLHLTWSSSKWQITVIFVYKCEELVLAVKLSPK